MKSYQPPCPPVPVGFESTNEFKSPRLGDWFIDDNGKPARRICGQDHPHRMRHIIKPSSLVSTDGLASENESTEHVEQYGQV